MALKSLKVAVNEKPASKKSDIPVIDINGELVTQYNTAVQEYKAAEAHVKEFGDAIKQQGLPELYSLAVANPDTPPSSVKLRDEMGATVRLTSQNKYGVVDPELADPVFTELGVDINDFVQFIVKGSFDSKIFLAAAGTSAGTPGDFSSKIYTAYKTAIDRVTATLIKDGLLPPETPSPLGTTKVAAVKPDFHARRWRSFPQVAKQTRLTEVISNTVTLTPIVE